MSPFVHADKIKNPLLLIHGNADNNAGTYPMQSERFYAALKGHGATVRLVMLPHESHGYQARESIMHMLWEMTEWMDEHVKEKEIEP
jgi:dipeptidyl aminopeptidase/acylaminoacyl peptidase